MRSMRTPGGMNIKATPNSFYCQGHATCQYYDAPSHAGCIRMLWINKHVRLRKHPTNFYVLDG